MASGGGSSGVVPHDIAIVRDLAELADALRIWCSERGVTRQALDRRAGLTSGHSGKLLGRRHAAAFGNVSLRWLLAALGLQLVLQIDPNAEQPAMRKHQRKHPHWRNARDSKWGRRLAARRALALSPEQRSEIARRAAEARWRRPSPQVVKPDEQ